MARWPSRQLVDHQGLADDGRHRHARVQGGERVLEDDLHVARQAAQLLRAHRADVAAVEQHLAGGGFDQAQDAAPGGALAAARFADHAQRLAGGQLEADAVDRMHVVDHAAQHAAA